MCGLSIDQPLVPACLGSTDDTDGVEFRHCFCHSHQCRNGTERLTSKIGVRTGDDNAHANNAVTETIIHKSGSSVSAVLPGESDLSSA